MPLPVEVVIMGQTFSVTSEDGEEHVREVAAYVDQTMRDITTRGKVVSSFTAAVLTALNIASEWHKLRQDVADMHAAIERLAARLESAGVDGPGVGEEKTIRNG
jgi:cell division protein ZapA